VVFQAQESELCKELNGEALLQYCEFSEEKTNLLKGTEESSNQSSASVSPFIEEMQSIISTDRGPYQKRLSALSKEIRELESLLSKILRETKRSNEEVGYRSGRADIRKRISELARNIPPVKTKSFNRNTRPRQ